MTVEEAYSVFKNEFPDLDAQTCHEYESRFVFNTASSSDITNMAIDTLYSVHKTDGSLTRFTPFDISEEEYEAGREVRISEESKTVNQYAKKIDIAKAWLDSRKNNPGGQ